MDRDLAFFQIKYTINYGNISDCDKNLQEVNNFVFFYFKNKSLIFISNINFLFETKRHLQNNQIERIEANGLFKKLKLLQRM